MLRLIFVQRRNQNAQDLGVELVGDRTQAKLLRYFRFHDQHKKLIFGSRGLGFVQQTLKEGNGLTDCHKSPVSLDLVSRNPSTNDATLAGFPLVAPKNTVARLVREASSRSGTFFIK